MRRKKLAIIRASRSSSKPRTTIVRRLVGFDDLGPVVRYQLSYRKFVAN
jgi:hypothetical protein